MTKGLVCLLPQELQPVPSQAAAVTSGKQLRVASSVAEAQAKPGHSRQDDAAAQQLQLIPVTVSICRSNIAVRIQREQTNAGGATSQLLLLPQAYGQPERNKKKAPGKRDLHMRNQRDTECHQRGARAGHEATQRSLRAKHYLECA